MWASRYIFVLTTSCLKARSEELFTDLSKKAHYVLMVWRAYPPCPRDQLASRVLLRSAVTQTHAWKHSMKSSLQISRTRHFARELHSFVKIITLCRLLSHLQRSRVAMKREPGNEVGMSQVKSRPSQFTRSVSNLVPRVFSLTPKPGKRPWERGWSVS